VADLRRAPGLSAEDVSAAVRIHADRVHDFVRRLGCSPAAAVEVVETSALDLVEAVANAPATVPDVVGWWFGRARALGRRVSDTGHDLPLGGGVLSADRDQAVLAETLDTLPERERVALLLRDSYALSTASVALALGTEIDAGMETVGRARLAFLVAVGDEDVLPTAGHAVQLSALARLAEGGPVAASDATARRHAQACAMCRSVWEAQSRAHLMLAGLTVVALPEELRSSVLGRIDAQARASLPLAAELLLAEDEELDDEPPSRWLIPLYALLGVIAAVIVGTVLGLLLSRGGGTGSSARSTDDPNVLPEVTAAPVSTASPLPTAFPTLSGNPSPTVFVVTPSPSPGASAGTSPPPTSPEPATEQLSLTADPTSGPNGGAVKLLGTGWTVGATVSIDYVDPLGRDTGSRATAVVDARGRFFTTLSAQDPSNLPGRHTIRATDGTLQASATYDVSG
jgi:DNA-directed RNA polymerase specialized sigma24 family protein